MLQRVSVSDSKNYSDLIKHPMFKRVADSSSCPELAVDFFTGLFRNSPDERMTAAEALQHPYLHTCLQEMQRAGKTIQDNPRITSQKICCFPRRRAVMSKHQQPTTQKLEWYFPPFEL